MIAGKGKRYFAYLFTWVSRRCQFPPLATQGATSLHSDCLVFSPPFLPRTVMARARVRPGRQGPGHWGAALTRLPGCCRRPATASLGSAFVFPTAITFAEVLLAPGAPGVQAVAALSAPKDDNRLGIQGEGDSSRRAGLGAETPPHALRPGPSSEAFQRLQV